MSARLKRNKCHCASGMPSGGGLVCVYEGTHNVRISWIFGCCIIYIIIVVGVVFVIVAHHAVHRITRLCVERFYIGGAFYWRFAQVDFWHPTATVNILKDSKCSVIQLNLKDFLLKPDHCGRTTYKVSQIRWFRAIEGGRMGVSLKITESKLN